MHVAGMQNWEELEQKNFISSFYVLILDRKTNHVSIIKMEMSSFGFLFVCFTLNFRT